MSLGDRKAISKGIRFIHPLVLEGDKGRLFINKKKNVQKPNPKPDYMCRDYQSLDNIYPWYKNMKICK